MRKKYLFLLSICFTILILFNIKTEASENIMLPSKSGPIKTLPWENNHDFIEMQKEYNFLGPMASYCTVLDDPLPGEEYNVHLAARLLTGTVIKPGEVFSQNQTIGPYTEQKGFKKGPTYAGTQLITTVGGGVCKIASTLYNVSILSNLQVMGRQPHSMPVPYVPYGQDATVAYGVKDYTFKNDTSFPIVIWAEGIDNRLFMAFYGDEKPPQIEWSHERIKTIPANKIYRNNPSLTKGTEKILIEGMDGAIINSQVTIKNHDTTVSIKKLGKSYYSPMPFLIEINK